MKTATGSRNRHGMFTGVAMMMAIAMPLVLSGCDDHSPVAAPTSTLPAGGSAAEPTEESSTPSIPDYDTDLDLTAEEKEAVEGALVAFEGFLQSINRAYSGDFASIPDFPKFASGEALGSIQDEAELIKSDQSTFDGEISPISVDVFDLAERTSTGGEPKHVVVHFCVDTEKWTFTEKGNTPTKNPDGLVTMEHEIVQDEGNWKVNKQSLWERSC